MNTHKYILLVISLLLPLFAIGQIYKPVTKREAEQIGKKMYILSSGDTTWVVNSISGGLTDPDAQFLFRKKINSEVDSLFSDSKSSYKNLEEAVLDIDKLLREVDLEERINNDGNDALAFRIARYNRNLKKKSKEANELAESMLKNDPSVEELTAMYLKFGDKPTYYINGVEVPHSLVNELNSSEVIKREIRFVDTASGNPNGEVWYIVTEKALERIKIPVSLTYDYMNEMNKTSVTPTYNQKEDLSTFLKEQETKERLKPEPVVRREVTSDGKTIDKVIPQKEGNNDSDTNSTEEVGTTRVIKRTVNNKKVNSNAPVFPASNQPARAPQTEVRQYNPADIDTGTVQEAAPTKSDDKGENNTPKKSVRRIKESRQNQD